MEENRIKVFGLFMFMGGIIFSMVVLVIAAIFSPQENSLRTTEKINPEWQLVTDGKVVDTLWIYKIK